MNLLAFVLLGFLAHSCSGDFCTPHEQFTTHVCDNLQKYFANHEGTRFTPFSIPGLGDIVTTVTGLLNVNVGLTYYKDGQYNLNVDAEVNLSSLQITGLKLKVKVTAKLGLSAVQNCLNLGMIEESLNIQISVQNKAIGGNLGGILGGLAGNLLSAFTSTVQLLLKSQMTGVIHSCISSINQRYQSYTSPVYWGGSWIHSSIQSISCTDSLISVDTQYGFSNEYNGNPKYYSLGNFPITSLAGNVASSVSISAEFINGYLKSTLDNVFTPFKKPIANSKWQRYGIYGGIAGDVLVSIKTTSAPSCEIKSSGSSVTISAELTFSTDHEFLGIGVDLQCSIAATRGHGVLQITITEKHIVNQQVTRKDDECGCNGNEALIEAIIEPIEEIVEDIFDDIDCLLGQGVPDCDFFQTPFSQPPSPCSAIDDYYNCNYWS